MNINIADRGDFISSNEHKFAICVYVGNPSLGRFLFIDSTVFHFYLICRYVMVFLVGM